MPDDGDALPFVHGQRDVVERVHGRVLKFIELVAAGYDDVFEPSLPPDFENEVCILQPDNAHGFLTV